MISSFQGIITEEWKIMGTVMHHVTGTCLTYANDSAVKREDTVWQEGRDVWWQVVYLSLDLSSSSDLTQQLTLLSLVTKF
jgi:hypothetical protein